MARMDELIQFDQRLLLALNGSDSLFWDHFMTGITSTVAWLPVAVVLIYVIIKNNSMREVGLIIGMVALAILVADQFSSSFCKPYFARFRPAQDPQLMYLVDVVDGYRGGRYGFISSHGRQHLRRGYLPGLVDTPCMGVGFAFPVGGVVFLFAHLSGCALSRRHILRYVMGTVRGRNALFAVCFPAKEDGCGQRFYFIAIHIHRVCHPRLGCVPDHALPDLYRARRPCRVSWRVRPWKTHICQR